MNYQEILNKYGLTLFVYYRKGATTHTGVTVAHDIEEAKTIIGFPETLTYIHEIGEIIDLDRKNSRELL